MGAPERHNSFRHRGASGDDETEIPGHVQVSPSLKTPVRLPVEQRWRRSPSSSPPLRFKWEDTPSPYVSPRTMSSSHIPYHFVRVNNDIDATDNDIDATDNDIDATDNDIDATDNDIDATDNNIGAIGSVIGAIGSAIGAIGSVMGAIGSAIGSVIGAIGSAIDGRRRTKARENLLNELGGFERDLLNISSQNSRKEKRRELVTRILNEAGIPTSERAKRKKLGKSISEKLKRFAQDKSKNKDLKKDVADKILDILKNKEEEEKANAEDMAEADVEEDMKAEIKVEEEEKANAEDMAEADVEEDTKAEIKVEEEEKALEGEDVQENEATSMYREHLNFPALNRPRQGQSKKNYVTRAQGFLLSGVALHPDFDSPNNYSIQDVNEEDMFTIQKEEAEKRAGIAWEIMRNSYRFGSTEHILKQKVRVQYMHRVAKYLMYNSGNSTRNRPETVAAAKMVAKSRTRNLYGKKNFYDRGLFEDLVP